MPPFPVDALDEGTVEGIRAGDAGVFERMYLALHRSLYALAMSYLHAPHTAEDLVQDVLCRVWERREQWEAPHGVRAYLYAAVRNGALNEIRRHHTIRRWEHAVAMGEAVSGMGEGAGDADDSVRSDEVTRAIARAVERLPERSREAYLLRWQHHLSNAEIAAVMGISIKGVEGRLATALQRLRTELDSYL